MNNVDGDLEGPSPSDIVIINNICSKDISTSCYAAGPHDSPLRSRAKPLLSILFLSALCVHMYTFEVWLQIYHDGNSALYHRKGIFQSTFTPWSILHIYNRIVNVLIIISKDVVMAMPPMSLPSDLLLYARSYKTLPKTYLSGLGGSSRLAMFISSIWSKDPKDLLAGCNLIVTGISWKALPLFDPISHLPHEPNLA